MKEELEDTKKTIEDLQNGWEKLQDQGKQCAGAQVLDPVRCYQQIHGIIAHSPDDKKRVESKMQAKCKRRHVPYKNPYA